MKRALRGLCILMMILCLVSSFEPIASALQSPSVSFEKYEVLLNNPKITEAMIWFDGGSICTYPSWISKQKDQLVDAIARIETKQSFPLKNPPQLTEDKYMSAEDAWTIYITHVAHSLWLEANHIVSWSILDYTSDELRLLFDSTKIFLWQPNKGHYFSPWAMGNVTDWNIDNSYQFMTENDYIKDDPLSTFYAFASWASNNVAHYFTQMVNGRYETDVETNERFWHYAGPSPVDRILYPVANINNLGFSNVAGCRGVTGLFSAVLRSVNIPTENKTVPQNTPGSRSSGEHGGASFPTLGIGMAHSDNIYGASCNILGAGWWGERIMYEEDMVPLALTFHTIEWIDVNMLNPSILDKSSVHWNSKEEQAGFNSFKYYNDLRTEYLHEYSLWIRAKDPSQRTKPVGLIESLQGVSLGAGTYRYAKDFYTEDEMLSIIQKFDDELIRIGNGDWAKGASIIRNSGKPMIIDLASDEHSYQLYPNLSADALRQRITWHSSDKTVATISDDGIITGLKKGTATITATASGGFRRKATRKVIVTYYAKEIVISGDAVVASGKQTTLKAEILPKEVVNKKVAWSSSNPDIAKVSSSGMVSAGKTSIIQTVIIKASATDGSGLESERLLTVLPATKQISLMYKNNDCTSKTLSISLASNGHFLQLSVLISPSNAYQTIIWKSSDTSIASVSENGLVTGLKKGTITITATAADGTKVKAECKVKVTD